MISTRPPHIQARIGRERILRRRVLSRARIYILIVYLEGQFQIFTAPDVEARVERSQPVEVVPVDGKMAAHHGGAGDGLRGGGMEALLPLRDTVPRELTKEQNGK